MFTSAFLLLVTLTHVVTATDTEVLVNTLTNHSGLNPRQIIQSYNANSTILSGDRRASNPDYRALYFNSMDSITPTWDPNSTTCVPNQGDPSVSVSVYTRTETLVTNGLDCIFDPYYYSGPSAPLGEVCCNVSNFGYMPMYQLLEDTYDTYTENVSPLGFYPLYSDTTHDFEGNTPQCCTQELYDTPQSNCLCLEPCCDPGQWCFTFPGAACGLYENNNDPTPEPTIQTHYPTRAPTVRPTMTPTLSCSIDDDCLNSGTCSINWTCYCFFPYYGQNCEFEQTCSC